jgi:hypothetical protein
MGTTMIYLIMWWIFLHATPLYSLSILNDVFLVFLVLFLIVYFSETLL